MRDGTVSARVKVHLEDRTDQRESIAAVDLGCSTKNVFERRQVQEEGWEKHTQAMLCFKLAEGRDSRSGASLFSSSTYVNVEL
jgi:hypothetical protein